MSTMNKRAYASLDDPIFKGEVPEMIEGSKDVYFGSHEQLVTEQEVTLDDMSCNGENAGSCNSIDMSVDGDAYSGISSSPQSVNKVLYLNDGPQNPTLEQDARRTYSELLMEVQRLRMEKDLYQKKFAEALSARLEILQKAETADPRSDGSQSGREKLQNQFGRGRKRRRLNASQIQVHPEGVEAEQPFAFKFQAPDPLNR